jgi:putative FmdB family regulatory protein
MPTYDYQCENCDHEFEKFQSITSNPLKKCPECKKMKLNRLIGIGGGIIFKGSGFYETDYRSENYKEGKKNAKPKTESKGADKKDTKKADSSESKDTPKKASKKTDKK